MIDLTTSPPLWSTSATTNFPVGLEEGPDRAWVHALTVPGCAASGDDRDAALAAFPAVLADWLNWLGTIPEPVPPREAELDITVEEWIAADPDPPSGETTACFDADLVPLADPEIALALRRLGDLRGLLLREIRRRPAEDLDRPGRGGWTAARAIDELARAQWWTLGRLGASPLADLPARPLGRLDTSMALVVQRFTEMPNQARDQIIEMDGETWTPRKVLRRLLRTEWELGRVALDCLTSSGAGR
jgi:predicted RNase H-like HicB family nuclease